MSSTVKERDFHKAVSKGDYFEIRLKNQAGTGYDWYLEGMPSELMLNAISEERVSSDITGGSYMKVFGFLMKNDINKTSVSLKFRNIRVWELDKPIEVSNVIIPIKK